MSREETKTAPDKTIPPTAIAGSRRAEWIAVVILILLPFLAYFPIAGGVATFAGYDHTAINQPLKEAAFDTVRSGHLPLWEHRLDRGVPLYAEGEAGIFYPLNLLFLIPADFLDTYNVVVLLLIGMAGLTFYWWIRRIGAGPLAGFLAAAAFQWSAPVNFSKANMNIMEAFVLAPLLMLLIEPAMGGERKFDRPLARMAGVGIVLAMMLFAGHSQFVVYSVMFAAIYIILRAILSGRAGWIATLVSMGVPLIGGAVLGAGLAAVQLLPTMELVPLSERASAALREGFNTQGLWLTPSRLFATFIFPTFHNQVDQFLPWLMTPVYAGPVAILLAGYSLRSCLRLRNPVIIPLLITALIFLWLAMGSNAPVAREITSLQFLSQFRHHGHMGGYFVMGIIALMGIGLEAWLRKPCAEPCDMVGPRKCVPLFLPEVIIIALLTIPFIIYRAEYIETRNSLGLMIGFLMIFFASILIGNLVRSRTPLAWAVGVVVMLKLLGFTAMSSETILDRSMWGTNVADLIYISEESQSPSKATMLAIPTRASEHLHARIMRYGFRAFEQAPLAHIDYLGSGNAGLMEDLTVCNADLPLELERWEWLVHRNLMPEIDGTDGALSDRSTLLLYILGINWIVTENGALEITGFERQENPDWNNRGIPYYIYHREYPLPEYTMYWQSRAVGEDVSEDATRNAFLNYLDDESAGTVVFLEGADEGGRTGPVEGDTQRRSSVSGQWESPTRYVAVVNSTESGIFVFRDAWYPGWSVTIDDQPARLLRADLVFKAVRVGAGQSRIVFTYHPKYLLTGWIISAVSAVIIFFIVTGRLPWLSFGKLRLKPSHRIVDVDFPIEKRIATWVPITIVIVIFAMIMGGTRLIARGWAIYSIGRQNEIWTEDRVLMQSTNYSSTPCCLVMLLRDEGIQATPSEAAWQSGTGPEGTPPNGIISAGKFYGFNVEAKDMDFDGLMQSGLPGIIEINYEGSLHAVYVRPDTGRDRLIVKSPLLGMTYVGRDDASYYFGSERWTVYLFEKEENA